MTTGTDESRNRSAAYEIFILGLSVYVILALAAATVFPLSSSTRVILSRADAVICVAFLFDFVRNLTTARNRFHYLATWGWIDLLSSIPTLSLARWGRAARIVRILRVLRGFRSARNLTVYLLQHRAEAAFSAAALLSVLCVIFSSIAVLQFEGAAPNANIVNANDALWWAYVTVTTVGYGDFFPVTHEGRILAALLMTTGVGLFGTFTGFVATWFVTPLREAGEAELNDIRSDIAEIRVLLRSTAAERDRGLP